MFRTFGIVLAILCGHLSGHAQEIPPKKPTLAAPLLSMRFGGAGQHEVELDGYGTCLKAHWVPDEAEGGLAAANHPYVSPAVPDFYQRNGAPIAYVRGSTPSLGARFRAPEGAQGDAKVSGELRGEFHVGAAKPVIYQASLSGVAVLADGEWAASALTCSHPLPNQIGYCEKLTIRWTITSADGAQGLSEVSLSAFYLLRQTPQKGLPLLHTPVDLACRAAAGLDDDAIIIDAVWQPFAKGHVPRAHDGQPLAYYGTYHSSASELRGLLVAGTGQCTTWAHLLHTVLGALGIDSDIMMVMPGGKGRILVKNWAHLDGTKFITSGPNGICETTAAGDDVQAIAVGAGRPNTRAVDAVPSVFPPDSLKGDDIYRGKSWGTYLLPGPDGILQTKLDPEHFVPVVPLGFGYAQQRGYQITDANADIRLEGDDTFARDAKGTGWVLTGPNGILETSPQDGLKSAASGRVTVSKGCGSTGLNLHTYLPRRSLAEWPRKVVGDDVTHDNSWISTGDNGIAETAAEEGEKQIIPLGKGVPDVPVIGPGPNGVLDTKPAGDDGTLDESVALKLAGDDHPYLPDVNIWPLEGVAGQQATNPPPGFPNHVILKVGGELYDPSYGTGPFPDHESWETASLFGHGSGITDADGKPIGRGKVRTKDRLSSGLRLMDPD
jgi:hypothetical protein